MPRLQSKRLSAPDETRSYPGGNAVLVNVGETAVGRAVYEPGWRWTTHIRQIAGHRALPAPSPRLLDLRRLMHVVSDDGQEIDIVPESIYEIPPGHDAWVVGDEPWITLEWTSARTFALPAEGPGDSMLLSVLFTDIVDSTATLQRVGDVAWRDLLIAHNRLLREDLNTFRGREVATTGDGFLAVFDGATRAVRCGMAMVRSARTLGLSIRVGVHTGEVEFIGEEARGLAVHAAARVMSLAGPDEVLVSSTTRDLLEGSGVVLEDAGTHELKGLPGVRAVSRVVGTGG